MISRDKIEGVLRALRIKPGLKWTGRHAVTEMWAFSFEYNRSEKAFTITLHRRADGKERSSTMRLEQADVETRGRSQWMTDNVWRLSEHGIDKIASSALPLMNR